MKKIILLSGISISISMGAFGQNVNIPDANFKAYLVGNNNINTNMDSEIQVTEANAYAGSIICSSLGITDLTGIEGFTSLTDLNVYNNNLTTLNVSQNSNLTSLVCAVNNLSVLDVSANTSLTILNCEENNLISLDLSQNLLLSQFFCSFNNITALDVTQNTNLTNFHAYNNDLSSLDVTQNTMLEFFYCFGNNITSLDVSENTGMSYFNCSNNSLTDLNMKNISTTTLTNFTSASNPSLSCIEVDNVTAATSAWTNIDPASSFSLNCITLVSSIIVMGQAGASQITTNGGALQILADVLPANADDLTYTWSVTNGTGSASIDASGLLTAISNGTVTITATANDGSGISGDVVITISNQSNAGISDLANTNNLSIYPNPSSSELTINYSSEIIIVSATILDAMGRTIPANLSVNNTIEVSNLSNGIYLLQIETDKGIATKKFIKE